MNSNKSCGNLVKKNHFIKKIIFWLSYLLDLVIMKGLTFEIKLLFSFYIRIWNDYFYDIMIIIFIKFGNHETQDGLFNGV
jgi:hypothetical protein